MEGTQLWWDTKFSAFDSLGAGGGNMDDVEGGWHMGTEMSLGFESSPCS